MSTLYHISGLPRDANPQQVRASVGSLIQRLHLLNAGDQTAEQRFREVNHAYESLEDPEAGTAHNRALVCRREEIPRRFWTFTATAIAACVLTASMVSLAVWWSQLAVAPRLVQAQAPVIGNTPHMRAQWGDGSEAAIASQPGGVTVGASQGRRKGSSWATYKNDRFGFAVKYPVDVFALGSAPADDNARTLFSRDGGATLQIFAIENVAGTTLTKYRRLLIEERYAAAVLDHRPQHKFWFVLSGIRGDKAFYERVTISCDGRSIHGWRMIYALSERTLYDLVADEVHRHYTHTSGPGARCARSQAEILAGLPGSR